MKTYIYIYILFLLILISNIHLFAEGTKEMCPTSSDVGNLQINDKGRPFAMESNSDSLHRLYFTVSDVSEIVCIGFNHIGSGSGTYRIMNPDGTIAQAQQAIPTSGAGFINNYTEAAAGPKIAGVPANGYSPIIFVPRAVGHFYIEFTTTLSNAYHFDYFDLTVMDASATPIPGRLWSYAWDLNTRSGGGEYNGSFYIYTEDQFITKIDMNGIQPYGFVVCANSYGTDNTPNANNENRKSVSGNHVDPQYKIFLNLPDTNVFPTGEIPEIIDSLSVIGTPIAGDSVMFSINVSSPGSIEVLLNLNGIAGYQSDSEDVLLIANINANGDTLVWDGKDGYGTDVEAGMVIEMESIFASGITHFPIYDAENCPRGIIVTRELPVSSPATLYWDDDNLGGSTNVDGDLSANGHAYPENNYGNERTVNTWWDGYRIPDAGSFSMMMEGILPIELISFKAYPNDDDFIVVEWETASEINNDYFTVERSQDGIAFHSLRLIGGATNSTTRVSYSVLDDSPLLGTSYYRLKQTDLDGQYSYSNIVQVSNKSVNFTLNPNPVYENGNIKLSLGVFIPDDVYVKIIRMNGEIVFNTKENPQSDYMDIKKELESGIYWVNVRCRNQEVAKKIVVL